MDQHEVLEKLKEWAEKSKLVQALILTSSRVASSDVHVDQFSDYDVVVYAESLKEFNNDDWVNVFGDVLVKWPEKPRSTINKDWITRLVLFESRLRIDFQITDRLDILPSDYDLGYQVIFDKGGITQNFPSATKTKHFIKKPSEEEFSALLNEFFWDATYVPKYLWRGNLFFAKFMFAQLHFEYLEKMIAWYIASQYEWSLGTNVHGKYFEKYIDEPTWEEIKQTFAGVDVKENWKAFYTLVDLFTRFARQVAKELGYDYPSEQETKMLNYFHQSQELKK